MNKIAVNLAENSYEIVVGVDTLSQLGEFIEKQRLGDKFIVITDTAVKKYWKKSLKIKADIITVPRGENYKNLHTADRLYGKIADLGAHRDSCIIAFGGGVIGDLASFVASTYMRGVNYIHVPTTLLAQVDSSIGGKTAVNHVKGKNLIGVFAQPKLVFTDVALIKTLPERELKTGLAEVVKYGIIKDYDLFKFVEANVHHLNTKAFSDKEIFKGAIKIWQRIVTESATIKAKIVSADEKENNLRMILNFGHTIGHAIELLTKYKRFNHGEAVSIGMCSAVRIAIRAGMLDAAEGDRIKCLLDKIGLPTSVNISAQDIISKLDVDKKVRDGKVQFVLPVSIGKVEIRNNISSEVIKNALTDIGCC